MAKTILITGASSGIGAGMAREFAQKGYNLAICARRLERLDSLKQELESKYGVKVITKVLDVTNYQQVFQVFREFKQDFGSLDRIIVNAGVGEGRRIGNGKFEINRATVETNFISALAQCEAAVEIFREQKFGHLVVISSMSALRGMPKHLTAYGASKAGVAALAEGIRAELIDTQIKVSTIFQVIFVLKSTKVQKNYLLKLMLKQAHIYWLKPLRNNLLKLMFHNGSGYQ